MSSPNVSESLIWEIVRPQNSFLVKRKSSGGVQFSRDPLNLVNKHSRKHAGFVNNKAIGIIPTTTGLQVTIKSTMQPQKPSKTFVQTEFGSARSNRNVYKSIARLAAKNNYRGDLRQAAVARASAIRQAQRPVKADPKPKLRGAKAKKAASESA